MAFISKIISFKTVITAIIVINSICLSALAKDRFSIPSDPRLKIQDCVNSIRNLNELPVLNVKGLKDSDDLGVSSPYFSNVKRLVEYLEFKIFGSTNHFRLSQNYKGLARINVNTRTIDVGENYGELLRLVPAEVVEKLTAFIFAHEMGHYFYEACVQVNKKSAFGFPAFIGETYKYSELAIMHGEVDAIGMFIMELSGFDTEFLRDGYALDQTVKAMRKNKPGYVPNPIEREGRVRVINAYLDSKKLEN